MATLDAHRALKLGDAAKVIQRKTKTHRARQNYSSTVKAAVALQSICRGLFQLVRSSDVFIGEPVISDSLTNLTENSLPRICSLLPCF